MEDKSIEEIREYLSKRIEEERIQKELEKNTNLTNLFNWLEDKEYILEMDSDRYLTVYQMDLESKPKLKDNKFVGRKIIDSYSLMCDYAKNEEDEMESLSMHRQFKNDKSTYWAQEGKFWNAEQFKKLQECSKEDFIGIKNLHHQTQRDFKETLLKYYENSRKIMP